MNKTTVVIPNYNGINYIENCLNSILNGNQAAQIIVVDNGSSDGSKELVAEKFETVKIIAFPENKGFSEAVNAGICAAQTEFVLLLNNDTIIRNNTISALEKALEQDDHIFSVAAKMLNMREPDKLDGAGDLYCALGWAFARGKDKSAGQYSSPCRVFSSCAGGALYRKELFEQTGLFDERHFAYLEDLDISYRANILGYFNIYVPDAEVLHAGSAVSGSRHNSFKVGLSSRNSIYLIYKNMPFFQFLLNLPFLLIGYLTKTFFFILKGMGKDYVKGLWKGFCMSFSKEGRQRKVKFRWKNLGNYLWIQGQLWINMLRFL